MSNSKPGFFPCLDVKGSLDPFYGASGRLYCPVSGRLARKRAFRDTRHAPVGAGAGREAPLVLIKEHLTDNQAGPVFPGEYRLAFCAGEEKKNWHVPESGVIPGAFDGNRNLVLAVQTLLAGGYEASVRPYDLEKVGRAMECSRKRGKREKPDVIDIDHAIAAAKRAKKKVRLLVKNMGATHLITLSLREGPATGGWKSGDWKAWNSGGRDDWEREHGEFKGPDDWARLLDLMRRMLSRIMGDFAFVAVLERHKKGNFHLHIAWAEEEGKKVNIGIWRRCWWSACGGRGCGNVDVQFIKVRAGLERADRVAKYISKYVTKNFVNDNRFNKKRYWASRQSLPKKHYYVLNASSCSSAFSDFMESRGLCLEDYLVNTKYGTKVQDLFFFPNDQGFWISYVPGKHDRLGCPF